MSKYIEELEGHQVVLDEIIDLLNRESPLTTYVDRDTVLFGVQEILEMLQNADERLTEVRRSINMMDI